MADIVIYTRQFCGFCTAALGLLRQKGVSFEHFDATMDQALRQEMVERTGGQTFPQIIINGKPIGGCDELFALEESGTLDDLLKATHEDPDDGAGK